MGKIMDVEIMGSETRIFNSLRDFRRFINRRQKVRWKKHSYLLKM